MSLSTSLREYIAACFTGLWVQSHEHDDALAEIAQLCRDEDWRLAVWDVSQGLQIPGQGVEPDAGGGGDNPLKRPRGVLLLGVPGTGKSAFAKALGNEAGRPTLTLDVGALMGSLVGQTESNIRQALTIADAMAPCVLMMDEVEKALAGVASSGQTDSGVSSRLFGTFLSWLNDHESDVFVIATCNDISKLPPEFSRAERFDGVFFLDLPGSAQKGAIWNTYLGLFDLDPEQPKPRTTDWTGAEIRSCCRLSALLEVPLVEAAKNVVPVAVTAAEAVERLRNWASGRCLDADRPGIFTRNGASPRESRRRVSQDPSVN